MNTDCFLVVAIDVIYLLLVSGWIAVIISDQGLLRHQEEMFSFSDKFSDFLNLVWFNTEI